MRNDSSFLPELVSGRGTARRSRVVEGQSRTRLGNDPAENCIGIAKNFDSRNAHSPDAARREPGIPSSVSLRPIAKPVHLAIHFDREPGIATVEIKTEFAGGMFMPKFESCRPLAKLSPEETFGQAHLAPSRPRLPHSPFASFRRMILEHRARRSTMLRMVPLPETSSGRN